MVTFGESGGYCYRLLERMHRHCIVLLSALSSVGSVTNYRKPSSLRPRPFIISQLCRSKVWAGLDAFPTQPLTHVVSARLGSHVQALGRICRHAHPGCWENPGLCGCGFGVLFSCCCRLELFLAISGYYQAFSVWPSPPSKPVTVYQALLIF